VLISSTPPLNMLPTADSDELRNPVLAVLAVQYRPSRPYRHQHQAL
jgi:hypothetical protein